MFAILGLIGAALTAAMFVDFSSDAEVTEDQDSQSDKNDGDILRVSDLLSEDGHAMPGQEKIEIEEGATPLVPITFKGEGVADAPSPVATEPPEVRDQLNEKWGGLDQDRLAGSEEADMLLGEDGDDVLSGAAGDDVLFGGKGDDRLEGGLGDDWLTGGAGNDVLHGDAGHDVLSGGAGSDMLDGGDGHDILESREDATGDILIGGAGDDLINAGIGDELTGGAGADTFSVVESAGAVITDFDPEEDVLEVAYDTVPPTLSTALGDDGLVLLANGEAIATLGGLSTLDLTSVRLVAL